MTLKILTETLEKFDLMVKEGTAGNGELLR